MIFDYSYLGNLLKDAREAVNMKQSEVAELIGCSAANISSWERAKSKIDIESLVSICDIYKVNFNDLMRKVHGQQLSEFTAFEKEHIKKYRSLDRFGKKAVDHILNDEYERCTYAEKIPVVVAARSTENKPVEVTYISKEKLEQIQNAKSVEDEVDL